MITCAIIAGCRHITKYDERRHLITMAIVNSGWSLEEIVCGGAPGIDAGAIDWAELNGLHLTIMTANWAKHSKAAGPIRNTRMAEYAKWRGGGLIAIWDGKSPGTRNMIETAKMLGIPTHVERV